jgi:hypothetical protein
MATYRVQVYATYNQKINWGGGAITYKDGANMKMVNFKNDSLVVYASPGLCSSALSSNNQVGIETNGTFGTANSPQNRGTSTAVPSYTYATLHWCWFKRLLLRNCIIPVQLILRIMLLQNQLLVSEPFLYGI